MAFRRSTKWPKNLVIDEILVSGQHNLYIFIENYLHFYTFRLQAAVLVLLRKAISGRKEEATGGQTRARRGRPYRTRKGENGRIRNQIKIYGRSPWVKMMMMTTMGSPKGAGRRGEVGPGRGRMGPFLPRSQKALSVRPPVRQFNVSGEHFRGWRKKLNPLRPISFLLRNSASRSFSSRQLRPQRDALTAEGRNWKETMPNTYVATSPAPPRPPERD